MWTVVKVQDTEALCGVDSPPAGGQLNAGMTSRSNNSMPDRS
jgi:hypothetical protein